MALMRFIPLNFGKIDPGGCDVCCSKWFAPKTNSEAKINPQFQAGFIGIGYHEKKVKQLQQLVKLLWHAPDQRSGGRRLYI